MIHRNRAAMPAWSVSWVLLLMGCMASPTAAPHRGALLGCLKGKNYAIRFLYRPPDETIIHEPLIFKPVETNDARYGSWSWKFAERTTVMVSSEEMTKLSRGLEKLGLVWKESPRPVSLEPTLEQGPHLPEQPYHIPYQSGHGMEILATCDNGSAVADLAPERICSGLASLDSIFHTPKAVYMFRGYREDWGCSVPGFDSSKIPGR